MSAESACECCVVMPAYNEAAGIEGEIARWLAVLDGAQIPTARVLVVDDGSKDDTGRVLDAIAARDARVVAVHQANAGHGSAVLEAYRRALAIGARHVFQADSDGEVELEDFPKVWARRGEAGLVLGHRVDRRSPVVRQIVSAGLRAIQLVLFGVALRDSNAPFRLMAAPFLAAALARLPAKMLVPNAAIAVLAARSRDLVEVPVRHVQRKSGLVGWSLARYTARSVVELVRLRSRLREPLARTR